MQVIPAQWCVKKRICPPKSSTRVVGVAGVAALVREKENMLTPKSSTRVAGVVGVAALVVGDEWG